MPDNSTTGFSADGGDARTAPSSVLGPDLLRGGDARTLPMRCAGVTATKVGTPGRDTITGTGKRDVIVALGGNDTDPGRWR